MQISYLKDCPELAAQLIPGLLDHYRYLFPEDTAEARAARFREHLNCDTLPIAWIAHEGDTALATAALRIVDLHGREDLGPWLGGVYTDHRYRRQGIASQLCHVVEAKAYELGITKLYLFTQGQEAFYTRLGWAHFESATYQGYPGSILWKAPAALERRT